MKKKSNKKYTKKLNYFFKIIKFSIPVILLLLTATIFIVNRKKSVKKVTVGEIQLIKITADKQQQIKLYTALIERVGVEEAQEQLYRSGLPFTGETHLLNHTAGDYIYQKFGVEGITKCRNYFLESCYHGLLLHVIGGNADKDFNDIKKSVDYCEKAGPTVVSQCVHGIGHGYVAAVGYGNLDKALEQCSLITKRIPSFVLYNCLDGAFMENIWAVHDGVPSPYRWVNDKDDYYPCNDSRLKPEQINPCWSNQPSLLFQRYGDLNKIGNICLTVTPEDAKQTCFNGLSRQIHPLTQNKADLVFSKCDELPVDWRNICYITIANSAFSVGDRVMPFEVCTRLSGQNKNECYQNLTAAISGNARNEQEKKDWCNLIKEKEFRVGCK